MRIRYPDRMLKELRSLGPFLVFNGKENVVREDAPDGIKERYDAIRKEMEEFKYQHTGL